MERITKTHKTATYFKGTFKLRDNSKTNWAHPIDFPTVFIAYGKGIKSGNWQSLTEINTPKYVIEHYFDNRKGSLKQLFKYCEKLELLTWDDVKNDLSKVQELVNLANNELLKFPEL